MSYPFNCVPLHNCTPQINNFSLFQMIYLPFYDMMLQVLSNKETQ